MNPSLTPIASPAPITTAAEAEEFAARFSGVMSRLTDIVQQETGFVRIGQLARAAETSDTKAELTRLYLAEATRLRASHSNVARLLPKKLAELRRQHDAFRVLLQTNLTVLATAHAVSEGIVRGVSGEMARKAMPQTYGSSGRANQPPRNAAVPLAVSRTL